MLNIQVNGLTWARRNRLLFIYWVVQWQLQILRDFFFLVYILRWQNMPQFSNLEIYMYTESHRAENCCYFSSRYTFCFCSFCCSVSHTPLWYHKCTCREESLLTTRWMDCSHMLHIVNGPLNLQRAADFLSLRDSARILKYTFFCFFFSFDWGLSVHICLKLQGYIGYICS